MLNLKLQFFGHLIRRTDSFDETLMLGKIEGGRRRGQQRMRWLDNERVIGRKARGLQTDEIGCKGQIFFLSLLSGRRKKLVLYFFPSIYKFKKRFLLKFCVAIMDTWFHLNLTFLKP